MLIQQWIENESKANADAVMLAEDVVKATGTAAFSRGPDGIITAWNAAAEMLMAVPAEEAIGQRCHEVIKGLDIFGNDFCGKSCNSWRMAAADRLIHPYRLIVASATGDGLVLRVSILTARGPAGPELVHLVELAADGNESTVESSEPETNGAAGEFARVGLTLREIEVLRHLAMGHGTEVTARKLKISTTTVRNHISRCLQKLDTHSRLEAVAVARRLNLV